MSDPSSLDHVLGPRDRFAFQAMNGLLARQGPSLKPAIVGRMAYEIADALMEVRGHDNTPLQLLRDRIAEHALNGLVANQGSLLKAEVVGRLAYELADALLAARKADLSAP
jgi:hypothetical protein